MQITGPQGAVDLSDHEYQLLTALNRAKDRRLEIWQLLDILGKNVEDNEKRALTVQFVRLRKKLADAGATEPSLKSIRGSGYQLCVGIDTRITPRM